MRLFIALWPDDVLRESIARAQRRYRPHITLARRAFDAKPPEAGWALTWNADAAYALVQATAGTGCEIIARSTDVVRP